MQKVLAKTESHRKEFCFTPSAKLQELQVNLSSRVLRAQLRELQESEEILILRRSIPSHDRIVVWESAQVGVDFGLIGAFRTGQNAYFQTLRLVLNKKDGFGYETEKIWGAHGTTKCSYSLSGRVMRQMVQMGLEWGKILSSLTQHWNDG